MRDRRFDLGLGPRLGDPPRAIALDVLFEHAVLRQHTEEPTQEALVTPRDTEPPTQRGKFGDLTDCGRPTELL